MQRNIDSFFKRVADKKEEDKSPAPRKRKALVISSDEEEVAESPKDAKTSRDKKRSRKDEDSKSPKMSKKPSLSKLKDTSNLKPVDAMALFGGETVRVEAKKPPKPKEKAIIELEDEDIDKSLMEVDLDVDHLALQTNEKDNKKRKSEDAEKVNADKNSKDSAKKAKPEKQEKEKKTKSTPPSAGKLKEKEKDKITTPSPNKTRKEDKKSPTDLKEKVTPTSPKKFKVKDEDKAQESKFKATPKSEKKSKAHGTPKAHEHQDLESSVLSDEERHERKRLTAILYQKYKNRSSCLNHGSKEVPKGKPDCLKGLTFVVTGVLESMERDEANSVIKEFGGKVSSTVGKRLNYLVVGEDAGPKKLAQAEELGIKILSEDGLFDLIREKSGLSTNGKGNDALGEEASTSSELKIKKEIKEEKVEIKEIIKKPKKEEDKEKTIKKEKLISPKKETHKSRKSESSLSPKETNNNEKAKIKLENSSAVVKTEIKKDPEHKVSPETVDENMIAWVDRYKPTNVKEIVGQQGPGSNVNKLMNWLSKWYSNHDGTKKLQKPSPWAKNDDGSYYKAALLSGPPGIGKTTTATLVCKELGFDAVEFNASDTRSKRLLKEEVSELLTNKSLFGFCHGQQQAVSKKHVLIMDEVDGMAGNEDRGGIQELIGLIKTSSVPIICMCNDRNHQKMRSLVNYCYDLRFNKPRLEQIKSRIMSICFKEHIKIDAAKVEEIIAATNNDIRQTINHISLLSAGKDLDLKSDAAKSAEKIAQKDLKLGPWEVVRKVFSADEHKHMTLADKSDLFFNDYSLAPLFVQQNYLQVSPSGPKNEVPNKVALTADALSLGDLVDKRIRSNMAWSLLPTQAFFSSVLPGEYMCGYFTGQINFPGWLGKNSRATKRSRLAQEIHDHTRIRTSGSRLSVRLDYAPFLLDKIVRPLKEQGMDGVEEALNVMKEYHLLREDIDSLIELSSWPGKKNKWDLVDGRVKAALTRSYNKEVLAYSYSATAGIKRKRAEAAADDDAELLGEEGEALAANSDDEKEDDTLENDGLIKAKKKTAATSSNAKPSTSKAKASTSKKSASASAKSKK